MFKAATAGIDTSPYVARILGLDGGEEEEEGEGQPQEEEGDDDGDQQRAAQEEAMRQAEE